MTIIPEDYAKKNGIVDESSILKHRTNDLIAPLLRGKRVLDIFAGIGLATIKFAEYADEVVAIEKNTTCFLELERRTRDFRNVQRLKENNIPAMKRLITFGEKFDFVDLDSFDNIIKQFPLALELLKNDGMITITTGEIFGMFRRRFKPDREPYWFSKKELLYYEKYVNYWRFPIEWLYPNYFKKKIKESKGECVLRYHMTHHLASRFIMTFGNFNFPDSVESELKKIPEYCGWIKKLTNEGWSLDRWS